MAPTQEQIATAVSLAKTALEAAVPIVAPFDPLIVLAMTAMQAHFNATKTWPTQEEVEAALPADYLSLVSEWAAWKPSGDGTLASVTSQAHPLGQIAPPTPDGGS
jgi:hypothetical protein